MRHLIFSLLLLFPAGVFADYVILLHAPGIQGDCLLPGYEDWIVLNTMETVVDRELPESNGGTPDINIGVGELRLVQITKGLDRASALLFQFAINGNSPGEFHIRFLDTSATTIVGAPRCYLAYKLDRAFVKSMKVSSEPGGRPFEFLELYFNRIASVYYQYDNSGHFETSHEMKWDNISNTPWMGHGIPTSGPPLDGNLGGNP